MRLRYITTRVLTLAFAGLSQNIAGAETPNPSTTPSLLPINCTTATTQLNDMKMPPMTSTGNIDRDYLMKADADTAMAMKMAQIEMQCGKLAAAKKAAQEAIARDERIREALSDALLHVI